jgi:hypothetical protein
MLVRRFIGSRASSDHAGRVAIALLAGLPASEARVSWPTVAGPGQAAASAAKNSAIFVVAVPYPGSGKNMDSNFK